MASIILSFITKNVYWLCLFMGLGGLLGYVAGFKGGGKLATLSIVIYWVVAASCSVK